MALFTPDEFKAAMEKAPAAILAKFDPAMRRHARGFLQGTLVRERLSGPPGLRNRRGAAGLRGSFNFAVEGATLDTWQLVEFSTSKYARIQELGGTVVPKKGKYLAIPLPAARTAAGVARGGPRSFPNTFFRKSKAGNLLLFQRQGKKSVPLFVLKQWVTLPARLGFYATWEKDQQARQQVLARAVAEALEGLGA
jgi:hypothetical protein